jgi:hypothetical protein
LSEQRRIRSGIANKHAPSELAVSEKTKSRRHCKQNDNNCDIAIS